MNYIDVKNFRKYEQLFGDNGPAKIGHINAVIKALNEATSGGGSAYKVYTALLTQSGGDVSQGQYGGTLVIGRTYRILDTGDPAGDWTNVGAPNNNLNTYFVATGEIPNSWGDGGGLSYNEGAPVVTVLENTIGNIWFTYDSVGLYYANSNNLFELDKTVVFMGTQGINIISGTRANDSLVEILTYDVTSLNNSDNKLMNTPIEIRVYY